MFVVYCVIRVLGMCLERFGKGLGFVWRKSIEFESCLRVEKRGVVSTVWKY